MGTVYYGIPVLQGILNDDYLQHFILFSEALWLLLQSAPSLEDVAMAERLLQHFCMKFSGYYGMYNIMWCSLWNCYSCAYNI